MYTHRFVFLLTVISNGIGVHSNAIHLTPATVHVLENSSITLTCSKTNGNLAETIWTNSQISGDANLVFFNNQCITTRFLKDSDKFTGVCNLNGTYSVVLNKIDRKQHGAEWRCEDPTSEDPPSKVVVIDVSVPATSVTLSPLNIDYMEENKSQKVICRSSACRADPRVRWYLRNSGTVMHNLTRFSTFTYIDGEYTLKAVESTLNLIPNRTVNGFRLYCEVWTHSNRADIKSRDVTLNITYPPDTYPRIQGNYSIFRVIESDTGTFVCSIDGGNPLALLSWKCFGRVDATLESEGKTVTSTIKWTALRGYSTCSCQANHINNWKRITNVTVNVQFPSEIKTFSLSSKSPGDTAVINKTDNASLVCIAEANPSSNLTIESPMGDNISEVSYSNVVRHTLRNASYVNAGEYKCTGRNNYTGRGSVVSSRLILIVKCPPRPSSGDTSVVKLATILHVDVTLVFSARMYLDEPNKTHLRWFKENTLIPDKSSRYVIRSEDLQTNLTVRNTTLHDLGLYLVNVQNSAGEYIHYYELIAAGKPDPPTDFNIIDNSITDSTVTLSWSPSFNGGLQQTFVLIYKIKHETVMLNESVIDNGKITMYYAIYGLSSMQNYEIEMFAKNREGTSAHTERLQFKTKAKINILKETICSTNTGSFIGVGVGTFFSTLIFVAFLHIGFQRYKKLKFSCIRGQEKAGMDNIQTSVTEGRQVSYVYTDLEGNRKEGNVYDVVNTQTSRTAPDKQMAPPRSSAFIEMKDTRDTTKETLDYINIKI